MERKNGPLVLQGREKRVSQGLERGESAFSLSSVTAQTVKAGFLMIEGRNCLPRAVTFLCQCKSTMIQDKEGGAGAHFLLLM